MNQFKSFILAFCHGCFLLRGSAIHWWLRSNGAFAALILALGLVWFGDCFERELVSLMSIE